MSAQANIVLTDDEATPVARTFTPQGVDANGIAWWRYIPPSGDQLGYQWLSLQIRRANSQSGASKVTWKLSVPTLEVLNAGGTALGYTAPPKTAFTEIWEETFVLPLRDSTQSRKNIRKMMSYLVLSTPHNDSVHNLEMAT